MNVTGVVVAASEIFKFQQGNGILFRVHNVLMNVAFHILFSNYFIHRCKRVTVCDCYRFSYLKFSAVELISGSLKVLFEATEDTFLEKIEDTELEEFFVPDALKENLFSPCVSSFASNHPYCQIISYQGVITKVKSQKFGIYELDHKINLYCTFNAPHSMLTLLEEGQEVFASNSHFLHDLEDNKVLVCCGLSSVRLVQTKDEDMVKKPIEHNTFDCSLFYYPLSIYDLHWLESFLSSLNCKLHPYFMQSCPFQLESGIIDNVLRSFVLPHDDSKRMSLGEEFFSHPHACSAFCPDILPVRCKAPLISDVLDNISSRVQWTEHSKNWKSKCISNKTDSVLVGLLFYSKENTWFIKDKSAAVPIVLSSVCDDCILESNILCSFQKLTYCCLVAIQNFEIVFEKIKKNDSYEKFHYFQTACCCLFPLEEYYIGKNGICKPHFLENGNLVRHVQEVSEKIEEMSLEKELSIEKTSSKTFSEADNFNPSQTILVLSKIWTVVNKALVCYQVLALILAEEESCHSYIDSSKCLFEDSVDLYNANDFDVSDLIEGMDDLFLNDHFLVRLHFESLKQCASLLPGHKYEIAEIIPSREDINFHHGDCGKPPLVKIKPNIKLFHSKACSGSHFDDYPGFTCGIEEIVSNKKVKENSLIRAELVDKMFEDSKPSCSSVEEDLEKTTLCLVVKDKCTAATMRIYLRSCPKSIYGYLPGVSLQLYGFICVCSRRGYLYLAPSSAFGINVVSHNYHPFDDSLMFSAGQSEDSMLTHLCAIKQNVSFKCLCFITKILSARLVMICSACLKNIEDICSCCVDYSPNLNVSFLIDDGSCQGITSASGDAAFKILSFSEQEQSYLTLYAAKAKTPLLFHHKRPDAEIKASALNEFFHAYCSSKLLCRKVLLLCRKKSDVWNASSQQTVLCEDVLKLSEIDLIPELMLKIKNNQKVS